MKKINNVGSGSIGCVIYIIVIVLNVILGAWSVGEILSWFGKDIPLLADAAIGLFTGEISIPVAIVGAILKACGVF
jgi:hypothetical protein